jgi:hypothetical protein
MKNRYDIIDKKEAIEIFQNAVWYLKKDCKYKNANDDGEAVLIEQIYSKKQSFGWTDYKDHRQDSLAKIKEAILKSENKHCFHQRLHFYKDYNCTIPHKKVVCWGYRGGLSAEFAD